MYRLRHMDVDDKVCEQVDLALLAHVYPKEAIERCVGQSQPWVSKARRGAQTHLGAPGALFGWLGPCVPPSPSNGEGAPCRQSDPPPDLWTNERAGRGAARWA